MLGRLSGAMTLSPEAKNPASRKLITRPRASRVTCTLPLFNSVSSLLWSVASDLTKSAGWAGDGGEGECSRSESSSMDLTASCLPRPSTTEMALLNWPCRSEEHTSELQSLRHL